MFSCRNCTNRVVKALLSVGDAQAFETSSVSSRIRNVATTKSARAGYATKTQRKPREQLSQEARDRIKAGLPPDVQTFKEAAETALKKNDAISRFKREKINDPAPILKRAVSALDGKTPIDPVQLQRYAKLELKYITDSFRLADRTLLLVKNAEIDQALELVRLAGKNQMGTTVAWNHILNTVTKAGELEIAWKLFNEMKKLGQRPDNYTISILLRGYGIQAKTKLVSIKTARKIYDSIYAPNSTVKPNIIHTNAMLEACARVGTLQTLFEIAAAMPSSGPNSPDQITYTIIFNALRNANPRDKPGEFTKRQNLIFQARRIWPDVVEKWTNGKLVMSEALVCAMGRVLMTGQLKEDRDDVLSLLQQTMRLPRQCEPIRASQRGLSISGDRVDVADPYIQPISAPENMQPLDDGSDISKNEAMQGPDLNTMFDEVEKKRSSISGKKDGDTGQSPEEVRWSIGTGMLNKGEAELLDIAETAERSLDNAQSDGYKRDFPQVRAAGLIFARPGTHVLSLAISACASVNNYQAANRYWDLITKVVTPDVVNYIDYMKILKDSRDCRKATETLREVYRASKNPRNDIELLPLFFWHAMSACMRAKETPTALQDATRVLAMMQMCQAEPQPQLIDLYTRILSRSGHDWPIEDVLRGVESLVITFGNIKSLYAFGRTDDNGPAEPSLSLSKVIHEIDPKWRAINQRIIPGSVSSRQAELSASRTGISATERNDLKELGQSIERAMDIVRIKYQDRMSEAQIEQMRGEYLRIRAWLFPRPSNKSHYSNRGKSRFSETAQLHHWDLRRTDYGLNGRKTPVTTPGLRV